jgi:hypothetical protein
MFGTFEQIFAVNQQSPARGRKRPTSAKSRNQALLAMEVARFGDAKVPESDALLTTHF